ncbi:MAG: MaoC/PaaZ C-terminal domain-containing protein, partial [Rhodospirillaceae bacterium]|nr:MaoC/PaaZ C-terminal domain-containing protein [Rhodospirillaceae bacterium]
MTAPTEPDLLYFEDFAPGTVFEWGATTVTEESIVAFGREFDPVPIHTDSAAARRSEFGGLIASGWQVAALMQRMQYESYIKRAALIASPGVDGLEFLRAVRPGDRLSLRVEVVKCRRCERRH